MPELGPYGSVRGARGNSRPYRESGQHAAKVTRLTALGDYARDPARCGLEPATGGGVHGGEPAQIAAGAKAGAGPDQHHSAYVRIILDGPDHRDQFATRAADMAFLCAGRLSVTISIRPSRRPCSGLDAAAPPERAG